MVQQLQQSQQHQRLDSGRSGAIDPEDEVAAGLITRILLEHFGDGQPVHADVVMDTVQYRLAREKTVVNSDSDIDSDGETDGSQQSYDDSRRPRDERYDYCVWADRRMSHIYHVCLMRLVRSGRVRVVYDCGGGCGGVRDDNDPAGRHCCDGCDAEHAEVTTLMTSSNRCRRHHPGEPPTPRTRRRLRRFRGLIREQFFR